MCQPLPRFPLGASDDGPQSVADRALDSFGISVPLLEFHAFRSKCADAQDSETASQEEISEKEDGEDEDDGEDSEEPPTFKVVVNTGGSSSSSQHPDVSDIAKHPEHAVKRHPFVVTRCVPGTVSGAITYGFAEPKSG